MKILASIAMVLITINVFADTAVYFDGDALRAAINSDGESKSLYSSLNLPISEGRSGFAKVFKSKDNVVEVYCTKSKIPVGIPYSCTISIQYNIENAITNVYQEDTFLKANFPRNINEAKELYDVLNVKEMGGRSGTAKVFRTSDGKAEIYCTKSSIPVGIPYGCTISLEIPSN